MHALHWRANPTARGMHESGGIMVSRSPRVPPTPSDTAPMRRPRSHTSANGHTHTHAHTYKHTPLHMQVNYVYELATIDANHSAYVTSGAVAASPAVRALVDLAVAE